MDTLYAGSVLATGVSANHAIVERNLPCGLLAEASGAIGIRLVPLLVAAGHEVAGMTRSFGKIAYLRDLGAKPGPL